MAKVVMPESSLNFPANSKIAKVEQTETDRPKHEKIVKGKVTTKKPSFGRRFANLFIGEDAVDVKGYILMDVFIPAIKDLISDVVSGGLDMVLFGEHRARGHRPTNGSYTSYSSYYSSGRQNQAKTRSSGTYYTPSSIVKDIIFDSRGEAEEVLGNMIDTITDSGMVSVADLYDMVGEPGQFTDHAWGWFDLSSSSVRRVREGYMLVLPKVQNLK